MYYLHSEEAAQRSYDQPSNECQTKGGTEFFFF